MKYQPGLCNVLTTLEKTSAGTVAGGQFDWGGRLRKSNGGARMVPSARTIFAL